MATATPAFITLERYLNTNYRPDRHFVDGETQRRNAGELEHSRTIGVLATWLANHEQDWNILVLMSQRIRVTESRVRIADVCAIRVEAPIEQVTETPPLLCVEVLSPKDRLSRTIQVMEDYLQMGVQNLWVIDPRERIAYTYTTAGLLKVHSTQLTIPNTPIYLDLPTLFAKLPAKS